MFSRCAVQIVLHVVLFFLFFVFDVFVGESERHVLLLHHLYPSLHWFLKVVFGGLVCVSKAGVKH